ncbi:MAG: diguanylate cyclase [Actinobacteria bacterium]|nr:MAG: diguanylate cyclase [Actinomycetota bacterium]
MPWAAWALASAVFAGFVLLQLLPIDPWVRVRVSSVFPPVALMGSAWACVGAARAAHAKSAALWRIVTAITIVLAVGLSYRAYYLIALRRIPPVGSLEDVSFSLSFLAMVPIALLLTGRSGSPSIRLVRRIIDFATMLLVTMTAIYVLLAIPLRTTGPQRTMLENVLFLGYPVFVTTVIVYLAAFKRGRWLADEVVLFAALATGALSVVLSIYAIGKDIDLPTQPMSSLINSVIVASSVLYGVAGAYRSRRGAATASSGSWDSGERMSPAGVAAQFIVALTLPSLIIYSPALRQPGQARVIVVTATMIALLLVARGIIAGVEKRRLVALAQADALTGLPNDRTFRPQVASAVDEAKREGGPVTACVLNLDGFDRFNRANGYAAGDRRLKWFAGALLDAAEGSDLVFRTGPDQFARIMPGAGPDGALDECRRLADDVSHASDVPDWPIDFSAGVASFPEHAADAETLVRFAEGALYWAKTRGPRSVVVYDAGVVQAFDAHEHVKRLTAESHARLVESLAQAVDARDAYTRFHSANVSMLSHALALEIGFDDEQAELLREAALLHDVGKIGVPDAILRKPGHLDEHEYAIIKEHPVLGVRILTASACPDMLPWILQHHERWDGTGYPAGLSGDEISLEARIMAVCDAYDAITTDRPYRQGRTCDEGVAEIRRWSGVQFDPDLVEPFAKLIRERGDGTTGESA